MIVLHFPFKVKQWQVDLNADFGLKKGRKCSLLPLMTQSVKCGSKNKISWKSGVTKGLIYTLCIYGIDTIKMKTSKAVECDYMLQYTYHCPLPCLSSPLIMQTAEQHQPSHSDHCDALHLVKAAMPWEATSATLAKTNKICISALKQN